MQASRPAVVDSPSSTTSEPWKLYRLGHLLPTWVPKIWGPRFGEATSPVQFCLGFIFCHGESVMSGQFAGPRQVCLRLGCLASGGPQRLTFPVAVRNQKSQTRNQAGHMAGLAAASIFFHVTGRGGSPSFLWPAGAGEVIVYECPLPNPKVRMGQLSFDPARDEWIRVQETWGSGPISRPHLQLVEKNYGDILPIMESCSRVAEA